MPKSHRALVVTAFALSLSGLIRPPAAEAQLAPQERLCDPSFQNCRSDLITYINQEQVGIDVGFWMMSDARYANALVAAKQRGVPIRVLMDPRCVDNHEGCEGPMQQIKDAGLPMRYRKTSGILHWKMMLFAGQQQLEFAGANYAPFEFVPDQPYVNYTDEVIFYTNDASIVNSFMTKFDDLWTSTTEFGDYANITAPLVRNYPTYPISPELNFPPDQSYRSRAVARYKAETQQIDVMMFRITDLQHTNAMVAAVNRGVPVRLITDETEYRNPDRLWDAYNVDIMYHAGMQVRLDGHQGIDHEKAVLLYNQGMSIFGSSNWTSPSSDSQREHNYFTTRPWIFQWLQAQFDRKWNNSTGNSETKPFVPLPPGAPANKQPANNATAVPTTGVTLKWYGGLWGQLYDVYFGTAPNPPLVAENLELGPSQTLTQFQSYALPALQPGTVYYWRIVSKTMAYAASNGVVWNFTTAGTSSGGGALPSGWADSDIGATGATGGASYSAGTFSVQGAGADVWGSADAFHFAYQSLTGDGSIVARVSSIGNTAAWAKAGVMIRGSLSAGSPHAFMLVSAGKGASFQRRTSSGGASASTAGSLSTPPRWVKLTRSGNTLTGFESSNGSTWTQVGSDTVVMGSAVYVGLGVTSHVAGTNTTATFDNVSIQSGGSGGNPPGLPSGWSDSDIGSVPLSGSASYSGGTFSVTGAGADIWGTSDAFHFAYRPLTGDGTIVARVANVQNTSTWAKAGVMIRETLGASSAHALMLVSAAKGVAFQRRTATGGDSTNTAGSLSAAPRWLKLTRLGNVFTAFESADGTTWTLVGIDTIPMASTVYIGLAVTSHSTARCTATIDGVSVP